MRLGGLWSGWDGRLFHLRRLRRFVSCYQFKILAKLPEFLYSVISVTGDALFLWRGLWLGGWRLLVVSHWWGWVVITLATACPLRERFSVSVQLRFLLHWCWHIFCVSFYLAYHLISCLLLVLVVLGGRARRWACHGRGEAMWGVASRWRLRLHLV